MNSLKIFSVFGGYGDVNDGLGALRLRIGNVVNNINANPL